MPVISLNIPPQTVLLSVAFGAIALYADSRIRYDRTCEVSLQDNESPDDAAIIKNVTYKRPLMTHLRNVLIADDFAALKAMCKLRSALDDIMTADFSATDSDMSSDHLKKIFTPVLPENARRRFSDVTSDLEKAQRTVKSISSAKNSSSSMPAALKNMELIKKFADLMPEGSSSVLQMKDMMNSIMPLVSVFGNLPVKEDKNGDTGDDSRVMMCDEDDDGDTYAVSAEEVITEDDEEYDSLLEIMRLMKDG